MGEEVYDLGPDELEVVDAEPADEVLAHDDGADPVPRRLRALPVEQAPGRREGVAAEVGEAVLEEEAEDGGRARAQAVPHQHQPPAPTQLHMTPSHARGSKGAKRGDLFQGSLQKLVLHNLLMDVGGRRVDA